MAFSTYSDLQTEITDWMARNDVQAKATTFIKLAEARLNRLIEPVSTTATLTGTPSSASIDVSSLNMTEPDALWVTDNGSEQFVTPQALGTYQTTTDAGVPTIWAIEGKAIKFERPCAEAYSFRFVHKARLGLSDTVTTNAFLQDHPDLYLAASIYWGCVYIQNASLAVAFKTMWEEYQSEVRSTEAQKRRGTLTVDPMLCVPGRRYGVIE